MERSCKKCLFRKTQPFQAVGSATKTFRGTSRTKETSNHPARIGPGLRKTGSFYVRIHIPCLLCWCHHFQLSILLLSELLELISRNTTNVSKGSERD